jgi:hypothetical protein
MNLCPCWALHLMFWKGMKNETLWSSVEWCAILWK